jgi:adenosylhomocysteine nucleosidase
MIGIIGAIRIETEMLKTSLTDKSTRTISGIEFVQGRLWGEEAVIATCGVGKVFAAICAQTMILEYEPDVIINTGVAGCTVSTLKIGDIVVADRVAQHDMDVSALGCAPGEHFELKLTYFKCAPALVEIARDSAEAIGLNAVTGTIVSGDKFIIGSSDKDFVCSVFNAFACEMEGGAIGQVCYVNNVPFVVIRSISDGADRDAKVSVKKFVAMSAKNSASVLEYMIRHYKRITSL